MFVYLPVVFVCLYVYERASMSFVHTVLFLIGIQYILKLCLNKLTRLLALVTRQIKYNTAQTPIFSVVFDKYRPTIHKGMKKQTFNFSLCLFLFFLAFYMRC